MAGALAAVSAATSADLLVTDDPMARLQLRAEDAPRGFRASTGDLTLGLWIKPDIENAPRCEILGLGDALTLALDERRGILVRWIGDSGDAELALARQGAERSASLADRWTLLLISYESLGGELRATAWIEGEPQPRTAGVSMHRSGPAPWPLRVGSTGGAPAMRGAYGLVVLRDEALGWPAWPNSEPMPSHDYFTAARRIGSGWSGVSLLVGHAICTEPLSTVNGEAEGARPGDPVNDDNLVIYNPQVGASFFAAGRLADLEGQWRHETPFTPGGFHAPVSADIGLGGLSTTSCISPLARSLARNEAPGRLVRVIATANSRAARVTEPLGGLIESWGYGGLWSVRRGRCAGIVIPAWPAFTNWPGFASTARVSGVVEFAGWTPSPTASFGRFGSHGQSNPFWPEMPLVGHAVIIQPGGVYVPKARPEPGSLFAQSTQRLTVRILCLTFPGAGTAQYHGEKSISQHAPGTHVAPDCEVDLNTSRQQHVMGDEDEYDPVSRRLTLTGLTHEVLPGDGLFISVGTGMGGIAIVANAWHVAGTTTLTLEHALPLSPSTGSLLRFGPVEPLWIEHAWEGLGPDDPEIYRGVNVKAIGGPVVVLAMECFNPDADGYIFGAIGRSGWGYSMQLAGTPRSGGHRLWSAIEPDVVLQFFATQGAQPSDMAAFSSVIREEIQGAEIWWCGDPDFDTTGVDNESCDDWHAWCLEHATGHSVGAVMPHERRELGLGPDRAADGQLANQSHPSARGMEVTMEATLRLIAEAALAAPKCMGDLDGDARVAFTDLVQLLEAWGDCSGCAEDLNQDEDVDHIDLATLLTAWGPCP